MEEVLNEKPNKKHTHKKDEEKDLREESKFSFSEPTFKLTKRIKSSNGDEVEVKDHLNRCKYRACKNYDISIEKMQEATRLLNGRKIDGFYVNDLIGRFGFYDGVQVNRADLARKYKTTPFAVDVAQDKLKNILQSLNIEAAYLKYINILKREEEKKITDMVDQGE